MYKQVICDRFKKAQKINANTKLFVVLPEGLLFYSGDAKTAEKELIY